MREGGRQRNVIWGKEVEMGREGGREGERKKNMCEMGREGWSVVGEDGLGEGEIYRRA